MQVNALPKYDMRDNPTNCCPRFMPEGWDDQELHFQDKLFLRAQTRSLFYIPINMGSVFRKIMPLFEKANTKNLDEMIILSRDPSPWKGEHYFSVDNEVPNQQMARLSGDYFTKVFEGPYKDAPHWKKEMEEVAKSRGKTVDKTYFFYTTCPKCAKYYGKNYVVGVAQIH